VIGQIKEEQDRFKVWVVDVGVRKAGASSLDHQLRDTSYVKSYVIDLLNDLNKLTGRALAIARGEQTLWVQFQGAKWDAANNGADKHFPDTEVCDIVLHMVDVVNCLQRLDWVINDIKDPEPDSQDAEGKFIDALDVEPSNMQPVCSNYDDFDVACKLVRQGS
jgi:hypothetical protein